MPFLIWSIIYEIELYIIYEIFQFSNFNQFAKFNPTSLILTIFTGNSKYHLYFIVALIQLYIIYWFFYRNKLHTQPKIILLCLIVTSLSTIYLYIDPSKISILKFTFFPWLFFFVLGMHFAYNRINHNNFNAKHELDNSYLIIPVFLIGAILVISEATYGPIGIHNSRISVMIYSVGFIILYLHLLNLPTTYNLLLNLNLKYKTLTPPLFFRVKDKKILIFLGKGSFGVYLLHPLILDFIWFFTNKFYDIYGVVYTIVVTISTTVLCYIIIYVINKYIKLEDILW